MQHQSYTQRAIKIESGDVDGPAAMTSSRRALGLGDGGVLLGRASERARLDDLLAGVRDGHSGVLLLRGEPGIGKTALLRYVIDSAPTSFTVMRCIGVESEMELPYAQLHELCSPLLGRLASLPEPQQRALTVALGLESGQSPDRLLVALAALGLLAAASDDGPVLCVIEDAHWLDQASAQVLGFVGRRLFAEPVGLVFAARNSMMEPDQLTGLPELPVVGLDENAARALLDSVSAVRVDERVRARILGETQGNPLALLELGARLGTAGFAGGFATIDGLSLADRIEDEYLIRLHSLPVDTQRLLLLAAADPTGDSALIQRASTGLELGVDAAAPAVEADLLFLGASVRFRHPLLRSAVYGSAGVEQRQAAHRALAEASDPDVDADRRAWHRAHAAAVPDEDVAAALIGSADRAQARGGAAAAAAFWERAVAVTPDAATRRTRALIAAQAKLLAGDFDATLRLLTEVDSGVELTDIDRATVDLLRAQVAFVFRGRDAPELMLKAANHFQALNVELARHTYLQALIATAYAGRFGDSGIRREIARAALALPIDEASPPAIQLLVRGVATYMAQGYVAAAPLLKIAVRRYRDEPPDCGYTGFTAIVMAQHLCDDAWHDLSRREVQAVRESGRLSWLPLVLDNLTESSVQAGELMRAEAAQLEADRVDPVAFAARSPRVTLILAAWRGDAASAQGPIHELSEVAVARGEGWLLSWVEYSKALLYNGLADYGLAADAAASVSADLDVVAGFAWRALYELVEASVRSGQLDRANTAAERLTAIAQAAGTDGACAMAARSRALLADGSAAEDLYRESIDRFDRAGMPIHLSRARLVYGEWLRRQNRRLDARVQLGSALDALSAMGVHGFAERARRELQATGEKVRRRTRSETAELTPQEDQIAELARRRRTNAEIGSELFLSARTVEWHLGKIFTKLGITSRRELDAALTHRQHSVPKP